MWQRITAAGSCRNGLLLEKMIPVLLGKATNDASRSSYTSLVICSSSFINFININIRLTAFTALTKEGICIQHILHVLHLVKLVQFLVFDNFYPVYHIIYKQS